MSTPSNQAAWRDHVAPANTSSQWWATGNQTDSNPMLQQNFSAAVQLQQLHQLRLLLQLQQQLQQLPPVFPSIPSLNGMHLQMQLPISVPPLQPYGSGAQPYGTVMQPPATMSALGMSVFGKLAGAHPGIHAPNPGSNDLVRVKKYSCGYCGQVKVSASLAANGRVRIRCTCGGKNQDNIARMHAMWNLINDDPSLEFAPTYRKAKRQKTAQEGALKPSALEMSNSNQISGSDIRVCVIDDQYVSRMLSIRFFKAVNPSIQHQVPSQLKTINATWQDTLVKVGVEDSSKLQDCLSWVNEHPSRTIVLLDRVLEFSDTVVDGLTLIPELSAKGALVLVFTGSHSDDDLQLYKSHGAFGCVDKMFKDDETQQGNDILAQAREHILTRVMPASLANLPTTLDPEATRVNTQVDADGDAAESGVPLAAIAQVAQPCNEVTPSSSMTTCSGVGTIGGAGVVINPGALVPVDGLMTMANRSALTASAMASASQTLANAIANPMVPVDPTTLASIANMAGYDLVPKTQPTWASAPGFQFM